MRFPSNEFRVLLAIMPLLAMVCLSMDNTLFGMSAIASFSTIMAMAVVGLAVEMVVLIRFRTGKSLLHPIGFSLLYLLIIAISPLWKVLFRLPFAPPETYITILIKDRDKRVFDIRGGYLYRGIVYAIKYCNGVGGADVSFEYNRIGSADLPPESSKAPRKKVEVYLINLKTHGGKQETVPVYYPGGHWVAVDRPEIKVMFDQKINATKPSLDLP